MKIQSVIIKGFRCYGSTPVQVRLSDGITALIGANGSGKTALLEALSRVFGVTRGQRSITRDDFYIPPGTPANDRSSRELFIDIRLAFPELTMDNPPAYAVAPCFRHMVVEKPESEPFCRVRLEAKWTDDGTIDGEVEQKLLWVTTDDETPTDEQKTPIQSHERGLIQVHYVPATRDASTQLNYTASTMAGRLLRAVAWSQKTQQTVEKSSQKIQEAFEDERAVQEINKALARHWSELYDAPVDAEPKLNVISKRLEEVIRHFKVIFHPTESGGERELEALSDGQKSLFYFALVAAVFDIEQKLLVDKNAFRPSLDEGSALGFKHELLQIPCLTVFALEEPENHLAPHLLARIINQIRELAASDIAQAIFTSHSPAVLSRVVPSEVRHFRLTPDSRTSIVRAIKLPDSPEEASKYVREAVIAYPEVYFAKFVILGEGASEQIVIPRLAAALKTLNVDRAFVAVVPLGGRHVNHFWKLLSDLQIPHATLIDLDLGRDGGGWERVKYICEQLLSIGVSRKQLLTVDDRNGKQRVLSDKEFEQLHTWDIKEITALDGWTHALESFGVFFSWPLDLDMAMLSHFAEAYQAIAPTSHGPKIPSTDSQQYKNYLEDAAKAVLGGNGSWLSVYMGKLKKLEQLFPWYRYLFLSKGKPSTHLLALSQLDDKKIADHAPQVLKRLIEYVTTKLRETR